MANHDSEQIGQELSEILKNAECPMCHSKDSFVLDAFVINTLSKDAKSGPMIVSETLPCLCAVCENCGLVTQHSVNVLIRKLGNGNK